MYRLNLRLVNTVLGFIAVGLALYVLLLPFLPEVSLWQRRITKQVPPLVAANQPNHPAPPPGDTPKENVLVIPKILLQQTIFEGQKPYPALNKGVWRFPKGGAPDMGGNTVLSGHRFTYGGPAGFYHLDKVAVGDEVILYWKQQKYRYQVEQVKIVPPTATEVLAATGESLLTLYTCTPLVTAKNRLVIQAKPITWEASL